MLPSSIITLCQIFSRLTWLPREMRWKTFCNFGRFFDVKWQVCYWLMMIVLSFYFYFPSLDLERSLVTNSYLTHYWRHNLIDWRNVQDAEWLNLEKMYFLFHTKVDIWNIEHYIIPPFHLLNSFISLTSFVLQQNLRRKITYYYF